MSFKHGLQKHPLYAIWNAMNTRCNNPNCETYKNYGGRGIDLCIEWGSFLNFYNWSINNGWQRRLNLDRKDNNKGYSPENCRFVSSKLNQRNRRDNIKFSYNGETKLLLEWAEVFNISYDALWMRLSRNKRDFEKAISTLTRTCP